MYYELFATLRRVEHVEAFFAALVTDCAAQVRFSGKLRREPSYDFDATTGRLAFHSGSDHWEEVGFLDKALYASFPDEIYAHIPFDSPVCGGLENFLVRASWVADGEFGSAEGVDLDGEAFHGPLSSPMKHPWPDSCFGHTRPNGDGG